MKICPNCGNEVKEDSNYCDKCGKSLVENDVIEPEVVDRTYESDVFVKEQTHHFHMFYLPLLVQ